MAGICVSRAAVLTAAGAVVAAAAIVAFVLFGGNAGVEDPETAPAPSTEPAPDTSVVAESDEAPSSQTSIATDDGAPAGASASTVEDAAASSGADTTGLSGQQSDPEPAEKPVEIAAADSEPEFAVEIAAADSEPEFALEIVEPTELDLEPQGGARQESPVESAEPDESGGGSGGVSSAQGDVHTWQDGDRTVGARLQLDLAVLDDGTIVARDEIVAGTGNTDSVPRSPSDGGESDSVGGGQSGGTGGPQPVFLSESGELMTLPGGVIVALDAEWDTDATAAFFARNGIELDRVSELSYLTNGFFVQTDPGFASLDLANALAGQAGVGLSSPNWSRERTTR